MGRHRVALALVILVLGAILSASSVTRAQPEASTSASGASVPGAAKLPSGAAGSPARRSPPDGPEDGTPDEEPEPEPEHPGERLEVGVLTFGPGDHPFFKFGHNAIYVRDSRTKRDRVYNYGTFAFGRKSIFVRFWLGRFHYRLSRSSLRATLRGYQRRNRSVAMQKLNLTPAERWQLFQFLQWNHRKENRSYQYHYYLDNCSTRVRDVIDQVVDGRIHEASRGPGTMTYRDHTLRLTADLPPELIALHVVMGARIDQPLTEWDEMFLPERLQHQLRKVTVVREGQVVPLVAEEHQVFTARRPPALAAPPRWHGYFLAAGCLGGALLAVAGRRGRERRWARVAAALGLALVGLLFGLLGLGFCLLWAISNHDVAYANENILHMAPWLVALVGLSIGVARGRPRSIRRAFLLSATAAASSVVGMAAKILPWFDQRNGEIIAFTLPVVMGATLATWWLSDSSSPSRDVPAPGSKGEATRGALA
ncbi:MAG: DUF4105 domain-containing protein [Deltaproteobacteria bacterium]|jgi:hypothetical protein|nr:DUF4105 domain-containing protein [Deltaproteobacteria bacterium]MBW2532149.1 DUF4105 domain-containing protein [Deltaproteobacteria bacterium]